MSEDGFSDCSDEPNMEIQIDTLMGTSFDMRVSSMDTIAEIKQRIQRVEGIPIHQQNLIFQSKELKDSRRLCDVGIKNGSIIKLVTAMKGGPISTRRLSVSCEHHMMLKELKELLENTRDEIGEKLAPGSKVSVLVFKEGDILNLLRVIENEDGSYSPYSEKPISPPSVRINRKENHQMTMFEKLVEDTDMMTKISNLRRNMDHVQMKRQMRLNKKMGINMEMMTTTTMTDKTIEEKLFGNNPTTTTTTATASLSDTKNLSYKLLAECTNDLLDNIDLKIFEKSFDEDYQSETEEIALKDKHRIKNRKGSNNNINNNNNNNSSINNDLNNKSPSLYSESKGAYSHTKQNYARIHKKTRELLRNNEASTSSCSSSNNTNLVMAAAAAAAAPTPDLLNLDQDTTTTTRSTVHLTRLVLSEGGERPKSSDSIELEEKVQDLWEISEPASDRLKHSATCKFGLLKRRQSLDYGFDSIENRNTKSDLAGEFNYCSNSNGGSSDFEVCSGNLFHVSSPSAIPPQYAPKDPCDYFLQATTTTTTTTTTTKNNKKSPLYGRKMFDHNMTTTRNNVDNNNDDDNNDDDDDNDIIKNNTTSSFTKLPDINKTNRLGGFLTSECSSIQRIRNHEHREFHDFFTTATTTSTTSSSHDNDNNIDELYGYYNLGCSTELLSEKVANDFKEKIKERIRKRLSITTSAAAATTTTTSNNKKDESLNRIKNNSSSNNNNSHNNNTNHNLINNINNNKHNISKTEIELNLPPVIKKKARCNECNKRLNITNIYNCRCGKMFCSQHRYSEVHRCSYDYKTEGKRILEHQNPLVAANKINRI